MEIQVIQKLVDTSGVWNAARAIGSQELAYEWNVEIRIQRINDDGLSSQ